MRINTYKNGSSFSSVKSKVNKQYFKRIKLCENCLYFKKNCCEKSYKKLFNQIGYCKFYIKK